MNTKRFAGCPSPRRITLRQRLTALIGKEVAISSTKRNRIRANLVLTRQRFFRADALYSAV